MSPVNSPDQVRVDAHHHFWDPATALYPWMSDELAVIRRAFGPDDLAPELAATGIDYTVLVQTRSSLDETREFLRTAAATPFVAGVVGWVDLTAPDVAETISWLRQGVGGDRLVGIRHQVHDEEDPDWLSRPDVRNGLAAVRDAGLTYDLLLRTREIPAAVRAVAEVGDLQFVIDHIAKPQIAAGFDSQWESAFREFKGYDNVAVKLSGMVTEADWKRWSVDDLQPHVDVVLDTIGPSRAMFGSDWPVCLLATTYPVWCATVGKLVAGLDASESRDVFGGTALRTYRLDVTSS
jgi:L-fuconolactonase